MRTEPIVHHTSLTFDLHAYLLEQAQWSVATFGPGNRTKGVIDHIKKELVEVEEAHHRAGATVTDELSEWVDVITLAFDGARRAGFTVDQIIEQLIDTQKRNFARKWPDWRTVDPDKAIEHDRSVD